MLLIPLAHGSVAVCSVFLIAAQLGDRAWPVYNISARSLRHAITPDRLLGRVNSSTHHSRKHLSHSKATVRFLYEYKEPGVPLDPQDSVLMEHRGGEPPTASPS